MTAVARREARLPRCRACPLAASEVRPGNPGDSRSRLRIRATPGYGVQLTAGPFVFSFPGELQFTM
jgi:hypothetical protein